MAQNARSNAHSVTLLLNPNTTSQQALRVTLADRDDLRDRALSMARAKYGTNASYGWLDHQSNKVTIIKPQAKRLLKRGTK